MDTTPDLGQRQPPAPGPSSRAIELLIGGRGLQIAGFLSVLFGTAFFLKIAIDNDWISESVRILIGLITGSVFVLAGFRSRIRAIGEGFTALGSAMLYLSLWAASGAYHLIPLEAALVGMLAVTAALGAVAYRRRSEITALFGIAGGFATPLLIPQHGEDPFALALYLLALCGGALALGVVARFPLVTLASFAALLYAPSFAISAHWNTVQSVVTAAAFFVEISVGLLFSARRNGDVDALDIGLAVANCLAFTATLQIDLLDHHAALGIMMTLVGVTYFLPVMIGAVAKRVRPIYSALGLGCVTLALPAFFSNHSALLLDAFAVEGAILFGIGARYVLPVVRWAGIAALGCTIVSAISEFQMFTAQTPVLNERFMTFATIVGALLVVVRIARNNLPLLGESEAFIARFASFGITLLAFNAVTREAFDLNLSSTFPTISFSSLEQMTLSLVWTAFASVVMIIGMRTGSLLVRWQSLAIFALTIVKVFSVDLASLDIAYRVGSFIGLGAVLLVISTVYLKAAGSTREISA